MSPAEKEHAALVYLLDAVEMENRPKHSRSDRVKRAVQVAHWALEDFVFSTCTSRHPSPPKGS